MGVVILIIDVIFLILLILAIIESQKRLLSFVYAVLAIVLVFALGFAAAYILMPARGNVIDVNEVLDTVGNAISIVAPIAAFWAATIPPRREAKHE